MFVSCLAVIVSLLQLFPVITASNTCNIFRCVFLFAGVFLNCNVFDLSGPPYIYKYIVRLYIIIVKLIGRDLHFKLSTNLYTYMSCFFVLFFEY